MYLLALLACRTNDLDTAARDADGDGYGYNEDCDDEAPEVHPDAEEICNGVDDDCDGTVDQGVTDASAWSYDADADDYGAGTPVMACTAPERHVAQDGDCDDLDADSYPGAPERCDEVDNDCDEVVDEDLTEAWFQDLDGDGFGAGELLESCDPEPGWVADGSDCDDLDAESYPEAEERCDEADNDCDESVDEGVTTTYYLDGDGDLWGLETDTTEACSEPDGYVERPGDCDDGEWAVNPGATELCNGDDDDCDGDTDEDDAADASTWYIDGDADGYGVSDTTTKGCEQPSGYADNAEDCDDGEWAVNPGATELCNGDDDDCDGDTDEDDAADASTWYIDYDGDSYGDTAYTAVACDQPSGFVDNDDDCDDFV